MEANARAFSGSVSISSSVWVEQRARRFDFYGHVGDHGAHQLKLGDRLAELLPVACVGDRLVERAPCAMPSACAAIIGRELLGESII